MYQWEKLAGRNHDQTFYFMTAREKPHIINIYWVNNSVYYNIINIIQEDILMIRLIQSSLG